MGTVVVATDKFKGSLESAPVARAVATGIRDRVPHADVRACPVADGGDGTVAAALAAGYAEVPVTATGPTGAPVATRYARHDDLAVVELADVSGLARLPGNQLAPMEATSRGTGEVIAAAVAAGCRRIVLGVGGSACTDGGAGMMRALGARMLDESGAELAPGGAALRRLAVVDLDPVRARMRGVSVTLACDVDNPLTGPHGTAATYGPQKGADAAQVRELGSALRHYADVLADALGRDDRDRAGSGAAGGVGFAALAMLNAEFRPGIDLILELVGFHELLDDADLVVTGEGSLDAQTARGKAPAGVAAAASRAGVPVVAVCGRNTLEPADLRAMGISAVYPLRALEPDSRKSLRNAQALLRLSGERIAAEHLVRARDSW